jgi:hypothetical protein
MKILNTILLSILIISSVKAHRLVVTDEDYSRTPSPVIRSVEMDNSSMGDGLKASNFLEVFFCQQRRGQVKECERQGEFSSYELGVLEREELSGFFRNACPLIFADTSGYTRKCLKAFSELNIFEIRGHREFRVITDEIGYSEIKRAVEYILSKQ